ncbi:MAG: MFS transporter [Myxococcota bacterium]
MSPLLMLGAESAAKKPSTLEHLLPELVPLGILLAVILIVVARLPRIDVGHSRAFLARRLKNWLPLGLTYSFLYMGRYNLEKAREGFGGRMDVQDFSLIFGLGTIVYGVSFLLNGPLTDKLGGRKTIMIAGLGAALANVAMGIVTISGIPPLVPFALLYPINMYFQSFGAVSIVKTNSRWFHVRERGVFGAIFGILISLGIYFAYDGSKIIIESLPLEWVFFIPAGILVVFTVLDYIWVRDTPADAGLVDFDAGDARLQEDGERLGILEVFRRLFTNKVILTIAIIEFCSGFLRQAIMQYYPNYVASIGQTSDFIFGHWGLFLCCAGILGGMLAGVISDRVFQSRRGPVAFLLYAVLLLGVIVAVFGYDVLLVMGPAAVLMSMAVIGVHGMLSGTASMDFAGHANTGVAVGIIDGFVYLGTASMALLYSFILPSSDISLRPALEGTAVPVKEWVKQQLVAAPPSAEPSNWWMWPISMIPLAVLGLYLTRRLWNAKPTRGGGGH